MLERLRLGEHADEMSTWALADVNIFFTALLGRLT